MTTKRTRRQAQDKDASNSRLRAAVYVRISRDRQSEVSTVVQERDGRAYATLKDWDVVGVYADIGISASKRGVVRPEYDRLLTDVEAGKVDVVIIWKLDRLGRSVIELNRVAEHLRDHGADLVSVHDSIDTSTPGGRFVYTVLAAVAQLESEQIALRVTAASDQRARDGKHHGGTRVFGYEPNGMTIRPDEAELILEAAHRILAGDTLSAISRDWNQRAIPTSSGGDAQWWPATISAVILSDHAAGIRRNNGARIQAAWPAIIDAELRSELLHHVADPDRRDTGSKPKSLLAGILYCDLCGRRLSISHHRIGRRYSCKTAAGGCGKIHVAAEPLEADIRDRTIVALSDPVFRSAHATVDHAATAGRLKADLAGIEARMDELAAVYAEDQIGAREWQVARNRLHERLAAKRTELAGAEAAASTSMPVVPSTIPELEAWWADAAPDTRRTLVHAVFAVLGRIHIGRPTKAGPFNADRVSIISH